MSSSGSGIESCLDDSQDLPLKFGVCAQQFDPFFVDADLRYRLEDGGYVLYSVGPNGKDDGAKGLADRKEGNEDWDDVVVRIRDPKKTP